MLTNQVPWLSAWESQGEKMVILGVEHANTLDTLMEQALTKTLLVYTVPSHTSIRVTVTVWHTRSMTPA